MQATVITEPEKSLQFTTLFRSNFQLNARHCGWWDEQNPLRKIAVAYSLSY